MLLVVPCQKIINGCLHPVTFAQFPQCFMTYYLPISQKRQPVSLSWVLRLFFFCWVFSLSAAAHWCIFTVLSLTDGLLSGIHPSTTALKWLGWSSGLELPASHSLFYGIVCHNNKFLTHTKFLFLFVSLCVCLRPFPSEDTALNEDDVYRSLEELAE